MYVAVYHKNHRKYFNLNIFMNINMHINKHQKGESLLYKSLIIHNK